MLTPLEITLQSCLQDFGIRELPKEWNPSQSVMIDGIALVTKGGGLHEYCTVTYDGEKIAVKRDYGKCASIISMDKVYAVRTLDKTYMPDLRSDKQIIMFLSKNGYDETLIAKMLDKSSHNDAESAKSDRDKVKKYVHQAAIQVAKRKIAEERRCAEIRNYAKNIKDEEE